MQAGVGVSYSWADEVHTTPIALTAPQYMRVLVDWAYNKLEDKALIPTDGSPMPEHLKSTMSLILRRLFRVYAHVYIHHFEPIEESGCEAHLNCNFKHFLFFVLEFKLVTLEEMLPLATLINKFAGEKLYLAPNCRNCEHLKHLL